MEYELDGDRAVIIVSALVAILSSSTSVSKDNIGTGECLCRDNLFFHAPEAVTTAKWRDQVSILKYTKEYYFTRIPVKFYACANDWYQALMSLPACTARI